MDYIKPLTELIYKQISKRIMKRKKENHQTNADISADNEQLLSNVIHNHRIKTRNPYLLTPNLIDDIMDNLEFTSTYELIWGSNSELDLLLSACILYGLEFLSREDRFKELVDVCCYNYLQYAKDAATSVSFNIDPDDYFYRTIYPTDKKMAFSFIRSKIFPKFKIKHKQFFEEKETKKLDKQLITFFKKELPVILNEFDIDIDPKMNGMDAFSLMCSIFEYENMVHKEEFPPGYKRKMPLSYYKEPTEIMDLHGDLYYYGTNFINAMVDLQIKTDPFFKDKPWIQAVPL